MGFNTYPANPWPSSTEKAGSGGGGALPIASADKLGGVKVGSGLSIDAGGVLSANGASVDYSTTEQATGQKWIDGSEIYVKVFSNLSTALVSGQAVDTTADISDVSKILYGFARADDEITYVPTAIYKINNTLQLLGYQTGNVIKTVILYYTKTEV